MMDAVTAVSTPPAQQVSCANLLRAMLKDGTFFWMQEFVPSVDKVLRDDLVVIAPLLAEVRNDPSIAGFSVADRVHSDRDPDPVAAATQLAQRSAKQPLVHWSGKGRDIKDLHRSIARMHDLGLENLLLLSGDKLREAPTSGRARYLESVAAVDIVKRTSPDMLVAVALNPFKYREEDGMAQYLKLGKKIGAGADYIITQIGFDHSKYEEAREWTVRRNYDVPLVANLMPMLARSARYMRKHQLAGVTITDGFLALLEEEEKLPDRGVGRSIRRLTLQAIGVRFHGYAGVQLTGVHTLAQLTHLRTQLRGLNELCRDETTWRKAWQECMTFPQGGAVNVTPARPWYLSQGSGQVHAPVRQRLKYRVMTHVHDQLFGTGPASWLLGNVMRPIRPRHGRLDHVAERFEHLVKARLFGCETCGMCRLEATQYICPETCPKGLANGPCGGTSENLCEFRDRECIHSVKYRIAKDAGVLDQLETWLIPAVSEEIRHSSSYPPHFRGEGMRVQIVRFAKARDK
ncbi:MAG: methylenetetrahydrofolate reductase C-terminal domain-containing protein [Burkholderiaceae bacterium]